MPYQQRWLRDKSLIKIWEKSRRIGATWIQAYEDVDDIITEREYTPGRKVKKVYFSSKDEDCGKEYIEYCLMWAKIFNVAANDLGEQVIEEDDRSKVKARILEFKNGGRINSLSSAPTAFNSKGGKIVWDESALHKDQRSMWSGAQPAAVVWGYPIRILSTHKGKLTLFYRFCKNAKNGKNNFSLHRVTIVDAVNDGLYDKVMGRATTAEERAAYVEQIRTSCQSEDIFQEDYMAEPVDSTTAFFSYEDIELCTVDGCLRDFEYLRNCQNPLFAGWDIGRTRDLSVIPILEYIAPMLYTRFLQIFAKTKFKVQNMFLSDVMNLPTMMRCCIDGTGMGMPLAERAQEHHGKSRVESITFNNANKETLAIGMKETFEDRRIIIPDEEKLREAIHSIKRMTTATGAIRFDAERTELTGHADEFWGLALAIHAKTGGPSGPVTVMSTSLSTLKHHDKFSGAINYSTY
ncbi:MAG: terminase family protein [Candidatus Paceibacterota bacterium]|jgi:phage FluMu gp28-like protein